MAIRVHINHATRYEFDRPVNLSPHIFRLRPAPHCRTGIESYSLKIKPENHFLNWQQDPFGNYLARVIFNEKTTELSIDVEVIADMVTINPFDFFVEDSAHFYPFTYEENLKKELIPYLEITERGELLMNWLKKIDTIKEKLTLIEKNKKKDDAELKISEGKFVTIDFLVEINQILNKELKYTIRLDPGVQTSEETLQLKSGSCRDFAWLFIQICRHLGLAARFVSGYLVQLTSDVKSLDGPSGPENDFTDLHAWVEVYLPGAGWIGLDTTSGLFASEGHIPLACTPSPENAAPVSGLIDICETKFSFKNTVQRIYETPRVTKPYTDDQWNEIVKLGDFVDEELVKNDIRLTMGGEPTFVSIDDMDSPQWNIEADGDHKRHLANVFLQNLKKEFAFGGLVQYGLGKWYPGEAVPRWQYSLYWRKDNVKIWKNPSLLSNVSKKEEFKTIDSQNFIHKLSELLGINKSNVIPAYEDPFYHIWEEQKIPANINALKVDLLDELQRKTIAELLARGLNEPKGFVLPLGYSVNRWKSAKWKFKQANLFLIPGNSPIGFRLPLKTLDFAAPDKITQEFPQDPFDNRKDLVDYYPIFEERINNVLNDENLPVYLYEPLITALCVEERNGHLFIFLPPLKTLENFLELVTAIEITAEILKIPIILEGYEAPFDWRIERLKLTPDPGVIELNIHPSKNWQELVEKTEKIYETARISRLGTEKFMIDGRHTGTGGGNHITLGGLTPADSPFLRRPDLLRSFVTFWQHHPALSYLFSTAFVGATSQAPRVDEGRVENLYELEIAFSQIPETDYVAPGLVDRLFRHLLTDITGNTHRSEFCIDKLFSPDSPTGRLGILEMRAFEMPPHYKMSVVQALLVRTLVAWFWKKPYKHNLVRWGTELYDKYLIEHFIRKDMEDVVETLNLAGYKFKSNWFDAFYEFRFPHYGTVNIKGIELEIRMGIEPWNVLGEEVQSFGTSRYVDSSIERVQVKVSNYNDDRYVILCNGCRIPLTPTGTKGEFVAAIRYKAWQPPSALHPTIGVDTPLTFDVVDTWNKRSIGGCNYFVSHPGGRFYDTFPVNSFEAESRRTNRFWDIGHSIPVQLPPAPVYRAERIFTEINPSDVNVDLLQLKIDKEFPITLDLRKTWRLRK